MSYTVIVLSSVTYALKAQGILTGEGIKTNIEKLTQTQSRKGCGYGLRVSDINVNSALAILKREHIKVTDLVKP